MSSRTPAGFYFASVCAAGFGAVMVLGFLAVSEPGLEDPATLIVRGAAAVLAALAGVAAEALWNARRWAYRSTLALALTWTASVVLLGMASMGLAGFWVAFWILFFSAWVVLPIVLYVRDRSSTMFGTPPRRRPAPPRPPAPPLPPGVRQQPWW
ncbi:MAG TPA: hypothetical protein VFS20_14260 [Longimicrobium sp.]|nr:hypothetical protein [Longimicrobium sp.]